MGNENQIKVVTPENTVEIDEVNHLITFQPDKTVTLKFANTECLADEEVKSIRWVANMFHHSPENSKLHKSLEGPKVKFKIPSVYSGGGLGWVEPVLKGKQPKFKTTNGFFINAIGPRSIDKMEWRDIHGAIIKEDKFFSEAVQLHIYTTGLYGHDIQIWLKDIKNIDYQLDLDEDVENLDNTFAKYFNREVKVYTNPKNTKEKVQKVIIDIRIERRWIYAGNELNVIPIVDCKVKGVKRKIFEDILKVRKPEPNEKNKVNPATKSGNKPVIVGDIVTDTADFKPCFFTKIDATYSKGDEDTTATIYDANKGLKPKRMSFAAVAGPRHGRKEVTIELNANTENCLFIGNEKLYHKDKVINLSEIEEAIVVESSKTDKGFRFNNKTDDPNYQTEVAGLTFEEEDGSHGDNNDNREFNEDHTSSSLSLNTIIGGVNRVSGKAFNKPKKTYSNEACSDTKVTIEVPYKYSETTKNETLGDVLQYIWPASKSNIQQYPIKINTCRQPETIINVDVYPDIKWTLQFCYNTDPKVFNEIRRKHKDYKVRIEQIENKEDREGFEEKINRHDDMAEKFKDLEKELDSSQKRIDKKKKQAEKIKNVGKKKIIRRQQLNNATEQQEELNQLRKTYQEKQEEHRKKAETYRQQKKKYKQQGKTERKAAKNYPGYSKSKSKLYDFENNVEEGISDIVLSLWADWDRPAERFEVTASYSKYIEMLKTMLALKKTIGNLLQGKLFHKKSDTKSKLNKKGKEPKPGHFAAIREALNPPLVSFNVVPPSIALAGSWYAENPKSQQQNEIGTNIEFNAAFDPIIGAEVIFNFAGMIRKGLPIINPIMAMMELGGLDVRFDLTVTGSLFAKGMIQYNTATGEGNLAPGEIKKLTDKEDDSPLEIGGTIDMELYVGIRYEGIAQAFEFRAAIELQTYASVVTGVTLSGFVEWVENDKNGAPDGVYLIPKLTFHGLKVNTKASVKVSLEREKSKEPLFDVKKETGGEFILMDSLESVLDFKIPLVTS